jgi:uncharacterized protein
MSNLVNTIKADSVEAMRNGEKEKLSTLRLLVAELEKEKISHKLTEVTGLSDEQAQNVISRQIKKLDKEIESYVAVGRSTEKQETEKALLQTYLPKQLTDQELFDIVSEIAMQTKESGGNIGMAMKSLSAKLKGKADMGKVSKLARDLFN